MEWMLPPAILALWALAALLAPTWPVMSLFFLLLIAAMWTTHRRDAE